MKKLFWALVCITPNPLLTEPTKQIFRKHNLKIAHSIIDSEEPFVDTYFTDPKAKVFQEPLKKQSCKKPKKKQ